MGNADSTWSQTTPIVGPTPAETFVAGLICSDMPTDGQVGMEVTQPAPLSPITVPMTPISNPNMTMMVQCSGWPAGGEGAITINYQQGATPPPPGANITAVVMILASTEAAEPMGFAD